ncbi:hypothetical protein GF359_08805 [candidate division WOR-3 bacterium]|uniref:Glutamine amidotransferase domain-containing protein n=1 Tax=candidate division WOR-3 bacterium TaxID=2052148 RepID=A0A9D5KBT8_UNCW3|nr:hypothetical protein [candidate division WOR-3 bacterium]MBD3365299.1 hypothetical protein [candidate division WOR-3 bacterium]
MVNKKPSLLLIEAHHEPSPADLKFYLDWLSPQFEISNVYIKNLATTNVNQDCIVVTGSKWQFDKNPVPETLTDLYLETNKPVLAICWGHQALASAYGARITKKSFIERSETIRVEESDKILDELGLFFTVWESHYEHVVPDGKLKRNFHIRAYSDSCKVEVIKHKNKPLWGVQFHPERSKIVGRQMAANLARIALRPPTL